IAPGRSLDAPALPFGIQVFQAFDGDGAGGGAVLLAQADGNEAQSDGHLDTSRACTSYASVCGTRGCVPTVLVAAPLRRAVSGGPPHRVACCSFSHRMVPIAISLPVIVRVTLRGS